MPLRGRAVAADEAGEGGYHDLAALFGIGYRTLEPWVAQYRTTESIVPNRPRRAIERDVRADRWLTLGTVWRGVTQAGFEEWVRTRLAPQTPPRRCRVDRQSERA